MALLDVRGLVKFYGKRKVVDGVSFEVNAGEVVGLLGPNGAGKTTSFRMATGQVPPNDGRVWFDGRDVTGLPMFRRARLGMGYLSQEQSIFRKLTVEKNLLAILEALPRSRSLGRKLTRSERWERAEEALTRFNLLHVRKNPAARCSGGEKRRLEIARCLVCEPLLILLDEPFAAVDPLTTEDIRHNIRDLAAAGIGVLLTDHNVREVLKITDRSYLIKDGRVVAHGTPEEVKRDPVAVREYLGRTFEDEVYRLPPPDARQPYHYPQPIASPPAVPINLVPADEDDDPPPRGPGGGLPASVGEKSEIRNPKSEIRPEALPAGGFTSATQQLLDHEKTRRLVDMLKDKDRWPTAWHDLAHKGLAAVPALIEALERREVEIRHLAFRLLEQITGETMQFDSDAADDVRLRQVAHIRAKLERRKAG